MKKYTRREAIILGVCAGLSAVATRASAMDPLNILMFYGSGFDYYVDSVNGLDTNDGLSKTSAFKTISKLLSQSPSAGVKIGLLSGSSWAEELNLSTLSNVTVSDVGVGATPVFDCADEVPAEDWEKEETLTNTYKVSWPVTTELQSAYSSGKTKMIVVVGSTIAAAELMKDIIGVNAAYNQAQVDTTPGSYYYNWGTNTLYIHDADSSDPSTNGKVYGATKRRYGVILGDSSRVKNVFTRRNGHNDGSTVLGAYANICGSLFDQGHVHNMLIKSGAITNCFFTNPRETSSTSEEVSLVVSDGAGLAGKTAVLNKCFFIANTAGGTTKASAFHAHGVVNNDELDSFLITDSFVSGFTGVGGPKTKQFVMRNSYLKNIGTVPKGSKGSGTTFTDHSTLIDTCLILRTIASGDCRPPLYNYSILNTAIYWNAVGALFQTYDCTGIKMVLDRVTIRSDSGAGGFNPGGSIMSYLDVNNTVFILDDASGLYQLEVATGCTYTGDYNVFHRSTYSAFHARFNGATVDTLADWQTASGQDAHSVYLTAAQAAAFWLGDPSLGDFRINPSAQVTGADGTVYTGTFPDGTPITTAGAQQHFDWQSMAVTAGPPSGWPDSYIPETRAEILANLSSASIPSGEYWQRVDDTNILRVDGTPIEVKR